MLHGEHDSGTYLAPSLALPDGGVGVLLAVVEGLTGLWLITGFRIRPAAWLVVAAGPLPSAPDHLTLR